MIRKFIAIPILILLLLLIELPFSISPNNGPSASAIESASSNIPIISNDLLTLDDFANLEKNMNRFIRQWGVAGASLAIANQGKLVYAKGFGFADIEQGEAMQPYHLLRVASVSKLITAVAIMKLIEDGKLSLNQQVFGENGILNNAQYRNYIDPRYEEITVKHLLNHSGGWTTRWGDHLFMNESIARQLNKELPIKKDDIIEFTLGKRLHFAPGTRSSYNNFGYLILERVIEKTSKDAYEAYVKKNVFKPLGISDAFIAHNYDSLRYPLEVRYYEVPEAEHVIAYDGQPQFVLKSRGGNDIRTLGAAGGWVISSVSLAKFLISIDIHSKETIICKRSIRQLTGNKPGFHPLGWRWVSSNGTKWRTGSFAGTSALALSQSDGLTYVFIANTSPWLGANFPYEVNRMMARTLHRIDSWPEINLFKPYAFNPDNYVEISSEEQRNFEWNDSINFTWMQNQLI
ncbi:MAG: serine hydrolase domain-containing protein [Tenuifilaceae bacterium]|jgi:CubicO group peptidase (beta-lactamase class C family)|nr:serine hydrolase domain-containing protein [Tenuifilaceae bacterium]